MTSKEMKVGKIWKLIRASLIGEVHDYTQGSIPKAVVLLAIPMILEFSLESVFALVDMFFVGKLGQNAISAVGLTESVITIVYSIAIGLSTAATAIVSRRVGEKNKEGAAHAGAQSLIVASAVTILISLLGVVFAADILRFMGAAPEVVVEGAIFTRIMFGGSISIMLLFMINGIFRGAGDAATAMRSLWIASFINIILCPVLVHYFGLKGAAIATVIGRSSGVLYQGYRLFKGSDAFVFRKHYFEPEAELIRSIARIGWPATLQFIIGSGSFIFMTRLVAETGGKAASSGYHIAIRNVIFFILPAWGLSNAAATLMGQNLGAKQIQRAKESVYLTAKYNVIFMGMVTLFFLFFAEPIIRVFNQEEEVVRYGVSALKIISTGYIFYGIGMVMTQALNGAGDTKNPIMINLIAFWLFQIPLAYFLAKMLNLQSLGVFVSLPVAETIMAVIALVVFRKGKWAEVEL